ncbi:MAG TPA: DUF47 family protein [Thermoleophilaceae bacterium]|nr:DUF47 family protein [Thermoleophilaceae bacterium]
MGLPLFASAPNRSKFEALFAAGGTNLAAATGKLDRLMRGWPGEPGLRDEIKALEEEGDRISRQALVALFAGGIDPMVVIRWKDVIDRLEQAVDACDRVAHVLEGIAVKHS